MSNKKKILLSVAITIVFSLWIVISENNDTPYDHPSYSLPLNSDIRVNPEPMLFYDSPQGASSIHRTEVLKRNVKGYREQTYWGEEHPIDQRTEDMSDSEFLDFIENEVKSNDTDIYWGAEY
nr:hypothetical protein [uncultured Draconibacterium sp.]